MKDCPIDGCENEISNHEIVCGPCRVGVEERFFSDVNRESFNRGQAYYRALDRAIQETQQVFNHRRRHGDNEAAAA